MTAVKCLRCPVTSSGLLRSSQQEPPFSPGLGVFSTAVAELQHSIDKHSSVSAIFPSSPPVCGKKKKKKKDKASAISSSLSDCTHVAGTDSDRWLGSLELVVGIFAA